VLIFLKKGFIGCIFAKGFYSNVHAAVRD